MSGPRHIWTSDQEEALLDIVESEAAKGNSDALQRIPHGFAKNAAVALRALYPNSNIQASHVISKLRCFKDIYKNVQSVLSAGGFVWDTIECCLKAADGAWDEYAQKGGSTKLKDKSCTQYNRLARIFGAQSDDAHIGDAVSNVLCAKDGLNSGGSTVVDVTPCNLSDESETISSNVWNDIASIREIVHHRHDTIEIYRALKKRHMDVNDAIQELLDGDVSAASASSTGDESHRLTTSSKWSNQQQFAGSLSQCSSSAAHANNPQITSISLSRKRQHPLGQTSSSATKNRKRNQGPLSQCSLLPTDANNSQIASISQSREQRHFLGSLSQCSSSAAHANNLQITSISLSKKRQHPLVNENAGQTSSSGTKNRKRNHGPLSQCSLLPTHANNPEIASTNQSKEQQYSLDNN